jgi:hypothetical protein
MLKLLDYITQLIEFYESADIFFLTLKVWITQKLKDTMINQCCSDAVLKN